MPASCPSDCARERGADGVGVELLRGVLNANCATAPSLRVKALLPGPAAGRQGSGAGVRVLAGAHSVLPPYRGQRAVPDSRARQNARTEVFGLQRGAV